MNMKSPTPTRSTSPTTVVMVNGLPGRMALATAEEVIRRGLILADEAMTGPNISDPTFKVCTSTSDVGVKLQTPSEHELSLQRMKSKYERLIIIDYTHPSSANANVELYCKYSIPFVLGTTGGDTTKMYNNIMSTSGLHAVIAPNMGKQIVAFQTMMSMMAAQFPNVFKGYNLSVKESHQKTKADTSGTAKAVVQSFVDMGINQPFDMNDIQKVRNEYDSINEMGVPEKDVTEGHAFHTYKLESEDKSVKFEFQHNVCGRNVYASGTVDAVLFIDQRMKQYIPDEDVDNNQQRIFSMIDILKSGKMS